MKKSKSKNSKVSHEGTKTRSKGAQASVPPQPVKAGKKSPTGVLAGAVPEAGPSAFAVGFPKAFSGKLDPSIVKMYKDAAKDREGVDFAQVGKPASLSQTEMSVPPCAGAAPYAA